jgi:hypothetical protein
MDKVALLVQIGIWHHFRGPGHGAVLTDTNPAISTVTRSSKHGKFGSANVTILLIFKREHPWRCPSLGKAYGL